MTQGSSNSAKTQWLQVNGPVTSSPPVTFSGMSTFPSFTGPGPKTVSTPHSRKLRRIRPLGDWAVEALLPSDSPDQPISQWIEVCGEVEVDGKGRVTVHGPILRMDAYLYEFLISRLMKGDQLASVAQVSAQAFTTLLTGNRAFLPDHLLSAGFRLWLEARSRTTANYLHLEDQLLQLEEGLVAYGPTRSAGELFAEVTARVDQVRAYASELDSRLEILGILAKDRVA